MYMCDDVLFVCDYVLAEDAGKRLTSFGDAKAIREGVCRMLELTQGRALETVCG